MTSIPRQHISPVFASWCSNGTRLTPSVGILPHVRTALPMKQDVLAYNAPLIRRKFHRIPLPLPCHVRTGPKSAKCFSRYGPCILQKTSCVLPTRAVVVFFPCLPVFFPCFSSHSPHFDPYCSQVRLIRFFSKPVRNDAQEHERGNENTP